LALAGVLLALLGMAGVSAAADKADPNDRMKALLRQRVDTAKDIFDLMLEKYKHGGGNIGSVHRAKVNWLTARLSLADTKGERVKIHEEIVKDAKEWEQSALQNVETGAGERIEALTARADRIEAEIALERAKSELELEKIPPPKK
jgi:outer membrane protein TolC